MEYSNKQSMATLTLKEYESRDKVLGAILHAHPVQSLGLGTPEWRPNLNTQVKKDALPMSNTQVRLGHGSVIKSLPRVPQ